MWISGRLFFCTAQSAGAKEQRTFLWAASFTFTNPQILFFFSFVMSFVVVGQVVAYILTAFNSSWRLCFNVLVHRKLVYELITKD